MSARLVCLCALALGCSDPTAPADAGSADAGLADAGARPDASFDGGARPVDAGTDAGTPGSDGGGDAASGDAGTPPAGECPLDGWCFVAPDPFSIELHDVWGSGPSDVWAVGRAGFIAHFDGARWSVASSPTEATLEAVHGSGPDDVWAVGEGGVIIHFDGATWSNVESPTALALRDVWAAGPSDAWAVGADRVRLRFDGAGWTVFDTEPTYGDYTAIWGSASDDVWLGSARGSFAHWNGSAWTASDFDWFWLRSEVSDLWGTDGEYWAVFGGIEHQVAHFDGASWRSVSVPSSPSTFGLTAVAGRARDDVWLLGQYGRAHWDGDAITVVEPHSSSSENPRGVWLSESDGWAVSVTGRLWRLGASGPWTLAAPTPADGGWATPIAWGDDDVWIAGSSGIERWNGAALEEGPRGFGAFVMWGRSPSDVWAAPREGEVQRWVDGAMSTIELSGELWDFRVYDIWGSAADDVWLVGSDERIVHFDGDGFATVHGGGPSQLGAIEAIDGTARDDVWAVDSDGNIHHYDGASWTSTSPSGTSRIWWRSVVAIAPDDVWAGGGGASLWHYDGSEWTDVGAEGVTRSDRGNSPYVVGFAHRGGADLHAITDQGHVLWLDGTTWRARRQLPLRLTAIAMEPSGTMWLTAASAPYGRSGNLLRRAR